MNIDTFPLKPYNTIAPLLYSYIRFSTIEQAKGQSLERQMSYARKVAEEKGLELDEKLTMKDMGYSGYHQTNIKRGALGTFLLAVEEGKVPKGSILVIESLDRISRGSVTDCNSVITQIINAGITVITAMDKKEYNKQLLDENPFELFQMLMIFIRAHEESEVKSKRVMSAATARCKDWLAGKRGFKIGVGKDPAWVRWCQDSKMFVFEPKAKALMLRKIELYKKGGGGLAIAKMINKEFGSGTVHNTGANVYKEVLRRSLIGELEVNVDGIDYVLKDYYPPLLNKVEFDRILVDSEQRGATKESQKFVGLLSGIDVFKCGVCERGIKSHVTYRGKTLVELPKGNKRYVCQEAARKNGCENTNGVQTFAVENAIVRYCQDAVNLQRVLSQKENSQPLIKEKEELQSRKADIEGSINYLVDTLLTLKSKPEAIAEKINSLEAELEEVNSFIEKNSRELFKISSATNLQVVDKWREVTKDFEAMSNDERLTIRLLIKDTFKEIRLHPLNRELETGLARELANARDKLMETDNKHYIDLTLKFHNGLVRVIRIDKYSGELIKGFDLNANVL